MSGRTHDHYCTECESHWSPFDFDVCPGCGSDENSVYDLNLEEPGEKEIKHGYCDCDRACMLTSAERYRARVKCRYRHGQVKPLTYFLPKSALTAPPATEPDE